MKKRNVDVRKMKKSREIDGFSLEKENEEDN
jgi:hypothetical protein